MTEKKPYPIWICFDCGLKYGRRIVGKNCTANMGMCDICKQDKSVTEPRDFGHLKIEWSEHKP